MKILLSKSNSEIYERELKNLGYEIETYTQEGLKKGEYPKDVDILIGAIDLVNVDLKELKNLKYIFLTSVGIDFLDLDYIEKNGIVLTNARGAYDDPIAEWVLYSLLQIEKRDRENLKIQEERSWKRRLHSGVIYGKKALILGTGTIAKETARRLKAFKCETIGYNTDGREVEFFDRCVDLKNLKSALSVADYVIMSLPDTEKTYHFFNDEIVEAMKENSVFVNISRGKTVDEAALLRGLKSAKIRAAALDVFEVEPLAQDSEFYDLEDVYIYPHISFSCEDMEERQFRAALHNLRELKGEEKFVNVIDMDKRY